MLVAEGQWVCGQAGRKLLEPCPAQMDSLRLVTRSGHQLVAAPRTPVVVAREYRLEAPSLEEVRSTDHVAIAYGWPEPTSVPDLGSFRPSPRYGSQARMLVPECLTTELAFLLGAYVSEGHTSRSNWTVVITNSVDEVLQDVSSCAERALGLRARTVHPPNRCPYVAISSKTFVELLDHLGCGDSSHVKRIPKPVLRAPESLVIAFLEGLFLDAFTAWMGSTPKWGISVASAGLLDDLQILLTRMGIVHGRIEKLDAVTGNTYGEVYAVGEQAQHLLRRVSFREPEKRKRASERLEAVPAQSTADLVPIVRPGDLRARIPRAQRGSRTRSNFGFLGDKRTRHVSRRTLERVADIPGSVLPSELVDVLAGDVHFSPVAQIEPTRRPAVRIGDGSVVNGFIVAQEPTLRPALMDP